MLNLKFRQENEVKLEYAPRITQVDWDRHASAVKNMHEEKKTRREILEALNHKHDFHPSIAQLNMHMRKRKLRVYGMAGDGDGHAAEATATELLPVEDELLPVEDEWFPVEDEVSIVANEILPTEHQFMRDADSVSGAEVASASTSLQTRAVADTSFVDMLDLLPLNIGDITPDGTQAYGEGAEEKKAEGRGRRMSDAGEKSIHATFENFENGADVLGNHERERSPSLYPYIVPREASLCSSRSHHSDLSSLREFREFAAEVSRAAQLRRQASQSSLRSLTIMSEESWNFDLVTGIPSSGLTPSSSSGLKPSDWEAYRMTMQELYIGRQLSLLGVQEHMDKHYGFKASLRMYKNRFSQWGLQKNVSTKDWMRIALLLRDREVAGQTQPIYIWFRNGRRTKKDYQRFLTRRCTSEEAFLQIATATLGSAGCDGEEDTPRVIFMDESVEQEGIVDIP